MIIAAMHLTPSAHTPAGCQTCIAAAPAAEPHIAAAAAGAVPGTAASCLPQTAACGAGASD
eukprot:1158471-Pelagomonas_calceolata.AAC.15